MASMEERNKAFVREAFNTLFIKRDYEAAARYWSLNYIRHSSTSSRVPLICTSRRHVAFWPFADVRAATNDVRCWGQSRLGAAAGRLRLFDP
jgi:hypothetical protein